MSNLLQRLAARATGGGAPARPRIASMFEGNDHDRGPTGLSAFDEERPAAGAWVDGDALASVVSASPQGHSASTSPSASTSKPDPARSPDVGEPRAAPRPAPAAVPVGAGEPAVASPSPGSDGRSIPGTARPSRKGLRTPVPARPVHDLDVDEPPATTFATVAAEERSSPARSTSSTGEPSVTIHIGRLDVRANLQAPPPPAPTRTADVDSDLSLSDYLRGRRG